MKENPKIKNNTSFFFVETPAICKSKKGVLGEKETLFRSSKDRDVDDEDEIHLRERVESSRLMRNQMGFI